MHTSYWLVNVIVNQNGQLDELWNHQRDGPSGIPMEKEGLLTLVRGFSHSPDLGPGLYKTEKTG